MGRLIRLGVRRHMPAPPPVELPSCRLMPPHATSCRLELPHVLHISALCPVFFIALYSSTAMPCLTWTATHTGHETHTFAQL